MKSKCKCDQWQQLFDGRKKMKKKKNEANIIIEFRNRYCHRTAPHRTMTIYGHWLIWSVVNIKFMYPSKKRAICLLSTIHFTVTIGGVVMVVYQSKFMTTNFNKLIKFSDVYFGVDFRSACFLIWQVRACSLFLLIYMRALKLFEFESGGGGTKWWILIIINVSV